MSWDVTLWLSLLILFLVVEASCPFHLVSIWFALGSLCGLLAAVLGGPVWVQFLLFLAVSCALLALLWPLVRKVLNPRHTATNVDSVIGTTGLVTAAIDNISAAGQVKLGAMYWSARSASGEPIAEGTTIRVERIEGVKVFVSPVSVPENISI